MKKNIGILAILIIIIVNFFNFTNYKASVYSDLLNANNVFQYKFTILSDSALPIHLDLLKQSASENQINLMRQISFYDDDNEKSDSTNYIYLTTESKYLDNIVITDNKINIEDMNNIDFYFSTHISDDVNQQGKIFSANSKNRFSIKIIDSLIEQYSYAGNYSAECSSSSNFDDFIYRYVELVNQNSSVTLSVDEILSLDGNRQMPVQNANNSITLLIFICFFSFTLVFLFYLVTRTNEICILRINGLKNNEIINKIIYCLYIKIAIITMGLILMLSMMISIEFLYETVIINIILYVLFHTIIFLFSIIFISRINLINGLKGLHKLTITLIVNAVLKTALSILIIMMYSSIFLTISLTDSREENLKNWETASSYGTFTPVLVGNDRELIQDGEYPLDIPSFEFYKYLEKEHNAIYIQSRPFMIEENNLNGLLPLLVNVNYLENFPVYLPNDQIVDIDENNPKSIYLVPEKYKDDEEFLMLNWTDDRNQFYDLHINLYEQPPKPQANSIEIIYIKNNQDVFSFNSKIFVDNNNMIDDAIIKVITNENALVPDINYIASGSQSMFIPIIGTDSKETYTTMYDSLKKFGLDDNFPYFIKVDDMILKDIMDVKVQTRINLFTVLFLVVLIIFVTYQYSYLIFKKNKYDFFVKKCFGYTFFEKYKNVLFLILIANLAELAVCFLVIQNPFFLIFICKFIFEIFFIRFLFAYFERKNTINILKGDI